MARGMIAWTELFGAVSFEVFGRLNNVIEDRRRLVRPPGARRWRDLVGLPATGMSARRPTLRPCLPRPSVTVRPLTADRLADLDALFGTNKTTTGCYCMWFLGPVKECHAGWGEANRDAFDGVTPGRVDEPMGLLAYRDGEPVGWCAAGPRSRYARALRSPILRDRDPAEDDRGLAGAVLLRPARRPPQRRHARPARGGGDAGPRARCAARSRASRSPATGDAPPARRSSGVEPLFASCGFTVVARPTASRVVMRRALAPGRRRSRAIGAGRSRIDRRRRVSRASEEWPGKRCADGSMATAALFTAVAASPKPTAISRTLPGYSEMSPAAKTRGRFVAVVESTLM